MSDQRTLSCADVDALSGVYVLGALEPDEADAVWHHLASCDRAHEEFRELAQTGSALASTIEPVDAPAETRDRVLAAIAATPQEPDPTVSPAADELPGEPASVAPLADAAGPSGRSWWQRWARQAERDQPRALALTGMAVAVIVAVVAVGAVFVGPGDADSERLALLRRAVAAASSPDATVAVLTGSDAAAGASGYAVFEDDDGFIVVDGLPSTDPGSVYQVWLVGDGDPISAGLLELTPDGLGTLTGIEPVPDTAAVALSIEELPGAEAPTTTPVVVGEVRTAST